MKMDLKRAIPYILIIAGVIGVIVSFALTYDKIQVLKDPNYAPSCNISPILSCGSVMKTSQASLFGIPNTIFGLIGFSVLTTLGVVVLTGSVLKRWIWQGVNVGALLGFIFAYYLFFEGIFRIHAICPFCFVIYLITPLLFLYTTLYNLQEGNLNPKFLNAKVKKWLLGHHIDIMLAWYLVFFAILITKFWYYWKTLI